MAGTELQIESRSIFLDLDRKIFYIVDEVGADMLRTLENFISGARQVKKAKDLNDLTTIELMVGTIKNGLISNILYPIEKVAGGAAMTSAIALRARKFLDLTTAQISDEMLEALVKAALAQTEAEIEIFSNLTQLEKEMMVDYLLAHPSSSLSLEDIIKIIREDGKVLNPETGFFYTPGGKDYTVHVPADPSKMELDMGIHKWAGKEFDAWKTQMKKLTEARKKARERARIFDYGSTDYYKYMKPVIDYSERIGEAAAIKFVKTQFENAEQIFPFKGMLYKGKSGILDLVFKVPQADGSFKYVVVEAKGGSSQLGSRILSNVEATSAYREGQRAQQGSREYLYDIIKNMEGIEEFESIAQELLKAFKQNNIEYYKVQQGINDAGELTKPVFERLNI